MCSMEMSAKDTGRAWVNNFGIQDGSFGLRFYKYPEFDPRNESFDAHRLDGMDLMQVVGRCDNRCSGCNLRDLAAAKEILA